MNIILTGYSGYLGGHVYRLLKDRGHTVVRFNRVAEEFLSEVKDAPIDGVAHLGWHAVPGSAHPGIQQKCVRDTERLLEVTARAPAFVYASTAGVYGDGEGFVEESPPAPGCAYTVSKKAGEDLIQEMRPRRNTILRLGSLMGVGTENPGRTRTDLVVNAFAAAGWGRGGIDVWDSESVKPVVHVRDAAMIIVRTLERGDLTGTINVAQSCRRAIDIARMTVDQILTEQDITAPEIRTVPNESGRGTRSTSIICRRLQREFPDLRLRTIREAVSEFKNWKG